jgi:hypothetical protein
MEAFLRQAFAGVALAPLNFFLFILPPLAWNVAFASRLSMPEYRGPVPQWYDIIEWVLRVASFLYPALLPIDPSRGGFWPGLVLYAVGLCLYCLSWLPYLRRPQPAWAGSPVFGLAPAYLPLLWLGGIALMAGSWASAVISAAFIGVHVGGRLVGRASPAP